MWGKQNDEQMIQNQPAPTVQPRQPAAAAPPVYQPHPAPAAGPTTPAASATRLGASVKIIGDVSSDEELYLDGDLEGKLELRNRLTIGPNSKVKANIKAQEVIVFGTIKGNVESESRVFLRTGASIVGDIKTAGIVIEDGAYFKGGIDISRGGDSKQAPKAQGASVGQKR
jgi:cytoskeletal protein CcmA (bactofilin family)